MHKNVVNALKRFFFGLFKIPFYGTKFTSDFLLFQPKIITKGSPVKQPRIITVTKSSLKAEAALRKGFYYFSMSYAE